MGKEMERRLVKTRLALGDIFSHRCKGAPTQGLGFESLYGSFYRWLVSSPLRKQSGRRKQARSLGSLPSITLVFFPCLSQIRDRRAACEVRETQKAHSANSSWPLSPCLPPLQGHLLPFHTPRIKMKQQQFLLRDLN